MKRILSLFVLLLTAVDSRPAATIYGSLIDSFGQPVESWVIFKPQWTPVAVEEFDIAVSGTRRVHTTNGVFLAENVQAGQYLVSFPSVERDICILVPTNTSFYSFSYLSGLCSSTNVPTVVSRVPNGAPPFAGTILFEDVPAGTGNNPVWLAELDNGVITLVTYEP